MSYFKTIVVQRKEWLAAAIPDAIRSLELIRDGKTPNVLVGRFVVTTARRLLRCVYGSDADAVIALRQMWLDEVAEDQNRCEDCDRLFQRQIDSGVFDRDMPKCAKHAEVQP